MLRLIARYSDAWNIAWPTDPAIVKDRVDEFTQACAGVGRDPATIEITVGTPVRLQPPVAGASPGRAIAGPPEEIARRLQAFAGVGTSHLIVELDSVTPATIAQLGKIVELMRA
jgi:alkanesulfonate monooxygenase SsuD/methylene tetrahydromethanopterin reductase-like flavin-dependent oxidoreductase (luciferase family)